MAKVTDNCLQAIVKEIFTFDTYKEEHKLDENKFWSRPWIKTGYRRVCMKKKFDT